MRSPVIRALSCLMAVVIATAPVLADSSAAMLQVKGNVLVNGSKTGSTAAVFAGDTLQTADDGSVALTAKGSTVLVAERSSLVYGGENVELLCGSAVVSTSRGLGAQVNNLTITPAGANARFHLRQAADQLQIAAEEGDLLVNDGERTVTLSAGNALAAKGGCFKAAAYEARAAAPAAPAPMQAQDSNTLLWVAFVVPIAVGALIAIVATNDPPSDATPVQ